MFIFAGKSDKKAFTRIQILPLNHSTVASWSPLSFSINRTVNAGFDELRSSTPLVEYLNEKVKAFPCYIDIESENDRAFYERKENPSACRIRHAEGVSIICNERSARND